MAGLTRPFIDILRQEMDKGSQDKRLLEIPQKLFQPHRMLIIKVLSLHAEAEFQELKRELGLTDGNLASHLRALENEGYVKYRKEIEGRKAKTYYSITRSGLEAFDALKVGMTEVFANV